jgi:isoaspartyl peptidase/L-asparaginase-like protein (Ntn-hydrolase superfamily)
MAVLERCLATGRYCRLSLVTHSMNIDAMSNLHRSTPERIELYRAALRGALQAGHKVLAGGGEAMDAAVAAITYMEGSKI